MSAHALTSDALRPGQVVADRHQLVQRLGRGGMGEVWLAQHRSLHTDVAIKFLRSDRHVDDEARRWVLERFRVEAQLSAHLGARSRHIVRVDDVGEHLGRPFLVMEYVRGTSLYEEIAQGNLGPDRVGAIVAQLADALAVVHAEGILHRDLKPGNVLLGSTHDGALELKLADFGVAKAGLSTLPIDRAKTTTAGTIIGTPDYMSPEQLFDAEVDHRSDCWAVGVLAYEMLTGKNPFAASDVIAVMQRVLTASVPRPSSLRPDLPRELDTWFLRALDKDRERRFPSVREMALAFLASLPSQCSTVRMTRPKPDIAHEASIEPEIARPPLVTPFVGSHSVRPARRAPARLAAAGALVLALLATSVVVVRMAVSTPAIPAPASASVVAAPTAAREPEATLPEPELASPSARPVAAPPEPRTPASGAATSGARRSAPRASATAPAPRPDTNTDPSNVF